MSVTWAASDVYGRRIALGPVQGRVLGLAMELTQDDRRPELPLHAIAARVSAPVSSVHDALRRLRALGLLGVAVRMGRRGGHRLWRVTRRSDRQLDTVKHRQAVARLVGRFGTTKVLAYAVEGSPPGPADGSPGLGLSGDPSVPNAGQGAHGDGGSSALAPLDPFLAKPMPPNPTPPPRGDWEALTFAEKMARYGYRDPDNE